MGVKRGQIVDPILESYELKLKDSMKTIEELRLEVKELIGEIQLRDKILKKFTAGLPVDYYKYSKEEE